MELDERLATSRQTNLLEQTSSSSVLNITNDYLTSGNDFGASGFDETQILDEVAREYLKFGFNKIAKKNDFILIDEMGDAFRHAGQNPSEDVIKDMLEKARALKRTTKGDFSDGETTDRLTYPDFLSIVHEYWYPADDDRQNLEEAFDILDPKRTAKLMIDDFTGLLRNCDWPEDEIDLILSQVSCGDGYFLYDDLLKLLVSPVELPKKKSPKPKSSSKKKKSA